MIILTYCFGKGQIWPLFAMTCLHIMFIAIGSVICRVIIERKFTARIVLYSCLYGLANIYCPNWINEKYDDVDETQEAHSYTLLRELAIQMIIILENIAMLSTVICNIYNESNAIHGQEELMLLAIAAMVIHLGGVFFRIIYYNYFHIWQSVLWNDFRTTLSKICCCKQNKVSFEDDTEMQQAPINEQREVN